MGMATATETAKSKERVTSLRLPDVFLRWLERYDTPIGTQIREDLAALMLLSNPVLTELNDFFTIDEACYIADTLASSDYLSLVSNGLSGALMPLHDVVYDELCRGAKRQLHRRWKINIVKFVNKIDEIGIGPLHAYQLYHMARMAAHHSEKPMKEFKAEVARIFQTKGA